jgi:hypothetical protein
MATKKKKGKAPEAPKKRTAPPAKKRARPLPAPEEPKSVIDESIERTFVPTEPAPAPVEDGLETAKKGVSALVKGIEIFKSIWMIVLLIAAAGIFYAKATDAIDKTAELDKRMAAVEKLVDSMNADVQDALVGMGGSAETREELIKLQAKVESLGLLLSQRYGRSFSNSWAEMSTRSGGGTHHHGAERPVMEAAAAPPAVVPPLMEVPDSDN